MNVIRGKIDIDHMGAPYSRSVLKLPEDALCNKFLMMLTGPCAGMFRHIYYSKNGVMHLTLEFPQYLGKKSEFMIIMETDV